jgi:adenylate cyclase, class 2
MSSQTEVEVKIHLAGIDDIHVRLGTIGAVITAPRVFEQNIRFDTPDNRLAARDAVLRLRHDSRDRLTYKDAGAVTNGIISRLEAEVEVSSIDTMEEILLRLGFVRVMVYEKYRTTYEAARVEVVVDEMPFGMFMEIEGDADAIETTLRQLGLAEARRISQSYVRLFDSLRAALNLPFHDLTFANFAGVVIPDDALAGL